MYKQWGLLLLIKLMGVVSDSNPFLLTCGPNQIDSIQYKYSNELRDQTKYINEIDYTLNKGKNTVHSRLHKLGERFSKIQYSQRYEIDISKCFDFNLVSNQAEYTLKRFHRIMKDGSVGIVAYLHKAFLAIRKCGELEVTCAGIDMCCDKVVEHFDVKGFENGIHELIQLGERTIQPILSRIDHDINSLHETTHLCILHHQQAKEEAARRRKERIYKNRQRKYN